MKCVTRQRIQVNRTATCWLIQRFLDPKAQFLFVPAEQVASVQAETGAGIEVPALHSHMLVETPHLFFMHFWANYDAQKADGVRAALDKINIVRAQPK